MKWKRMNLESYPIANYLLSPSFIMETITTVGSLKLLSWATFCRQTPDSRSQLTPLVLFFQNTSTVSIIALLTWQFNSWFTYPDITYLILPNYGHSVLICCLCSPYSYSNTQSSTEQALYTYVGHISSQNLKFSSLDIDCNSRNILHIEQIVSEQLFIYLIL